MTESDMTGSDKTGSDKTGSDLTSSEMADTSGQGSGGADDSGTDAGTSAEKDPQDWTTGDEPPTGPQLSYLSTLAREAGVDVPGDLTKASASQLIDDLQSRTGRGQSGSGA